MLTLCFFFTFLYAWAEARSDAHTISQDVYIDHKRGAWERFACLMGFAVLAHYTLFVERDLLELRTLIVIARCVAVWACLLFCFWISFDLLLNSMRDKNLLYVGEDKRTAWLDKMALKYLNSSSKKAGLLLLIIKLIALVFVSTLHTYLVYGAF